MKFYNLHKALDNKGEATALILNQADLEHFPEAIFSLEKLDYLDLSNNQISHIPDKIKNLSKLRYLNLAKNQIKFLPKGLSQLSKLEKIDLDQNQLTEVPNSLFQVPNLIWLSLKNNHLEKLDPGIHLSTSLKELDLEGNQLKKLPKELGRLKDLKHLNVSNNSITRLPVDLFNCKAMEFFNGGSNRISRLPDHIKDWTRLTKLILSKNRLKELPETLGRCIALRHLQLDKNQIKVLPTAIGRLQWLSVLNVERNQIEILPKRLFNAKRIQYLNLSGNQLNTLPKTIRQPNRLYYLNISKNHIHDLPELPNSITHLIYSSNKLNQVPLGVSGLMKLKILDLTDNEIETWPAQINHLPSLEILWLKRNPLTLIPKAFIGFSQLKRINGVGNIQTRSQFFKLLKGCTLHKTPVSQRLIYFSFLKSGRLEKLDMEKLDLESALNFPIPEIRFAVRDYLFGKSSDPISLPAGAQLFILGNVNFSTRDLAQRLAPFKISLAKAWTPEVSHLVLGYWPEWEMGLNAIQLPLLSEGQINQFLMDREEQYLVKEPSPKEIENLKRLILSADLTNVRMAIQLMKSAGVPKKLLTELFFVWKVIKDRKLKKAIKQLLELNLSEMGKLALYQTVRISSKTTFNKIERHIHTLTSKNEIDGELLAQLIVKAIGKGLL